MEKYCDLFAPRGTLFDAGMAAPIEGAAIGQAISQVLAVMPDFRFDAVRIGRSAPYVFVEAANTGTIGGRTCAWKAIYAVTLTGSQVRTGRRYYDRAELFRNLIDRADDEAPTVDVQSLGLTVDRSADTPDGTFVEYTGKIESGGMSLSYGYVERTVGDETVRVHDTLVFKPDLAARINEALSSFTRTQPR